MFQKLDMLPFSCTGRETSALFCPLQRANLNQSLPFLTWRWKQIRRVVSSGMLRRVALVRTDVSEEPSASFIRVTRIGELGTTLAATSNRLTLRRNTKWERKLEWNSELGIPLGFFVVTAVKTSNLTETNKFFETCFLVIYNSGRLRLIQTPSNG
jgi:hypothetical protein